MTASLSQFDPPPGEKFRSAMQLCLSFLAWPVNDGRVPCQTIHAVLTQRAPYGSIIGKLFMLRGTFVRKQIWAWVTTASASCYNSEEMMTEIISSMLPLYWSGTAVITIL